MTLSDVIPQVKVADILGPLVDLRPAGQGKFRSVCPIHTGADNKSSFSVDEIGGHAHCFKCGGHWNKIELAMALHGLTRKQAAHFLAGLIGASLDDSSEDRELQQEIARAAEAEAQAVVAWRNTRYLNLWHERGLLEAAKVSAETWIKRKLALSLTAIADPFEEIAHARYHEYTQRLNAIDTEMHELTDPSWPKLIEDYRRATRELGKPKLASERERIISDLMINGVFEKDSFDSLKPWMLNELYGNGYLLDPEIALLVWMKRGGPEQLSPEQFDAGWRAFASGEKPAARA